MGLFLHQFIDLTDWCTGSTADGLLLALVEPCLGIICACLPVMRPLFSSIYVHVTRSVFSSKNSKNSTDSSGSRTYRTHSSSNLKSDTHALRTQPESGWMELGGQDSHIFINKIQGNAAVLESEDDQGSSTLPRNVIRVRSDLESRTSRQ